RSAEVAAVAHVVCQVIHRPDEVTFLWSDGAASFEPYRLTGPEREQLDRLARQARERLAQAAAGEAGDVGPALAQLGQQLYRAVFQLDATDRGSAAEVEDWFRNLQQQNQVRHLEILGDAPGRIPWNLLCD